MDTLRFIPAKTHADCHALEALALPIWREHYTPIIGKEQVDYMLQKFQTAHAIEGQIREGIHYFFLQNPEEENIGYLSVVYRPEDLFLSKLYLLKTFRGQGWARVALEFVKTLARNKNLERITLTVHKQNPSVKAYQALGFEILEPVTTDIGGGYFMDDYRMGLDLA
jgi:GNAT superfamily N-acetyltransferase